jgi:hydrogenase maturation protein HypF
VAGLQAQGLRVHTAQALSCGDAGLALGQAWVAAQQLAQAQPSMDSEETAACA